MSISDGLYYFVFDVEKEGLAGSPFAFGAVLLDSGFNEIECFYQGTKPIYEMITKEEDMVFIRDVVAPVNPVTLESRMSLYAYCSRLLLSIKENYPNVRFFADVPFPCETDLLQNLDIYLMMGGSEKRVSQAVYPLLDIASMLFARGFAPEYSYARIRENEFPVHNALADARQSARVLKNIITNGSPYATP